MRHLLAFAALLPLAATAHAQVPDPATSADPGAFAHEYLARSKVYTTRSELLPAELLPDGTAEVEGIVGNERCTVHMARAKSDPRRWEVSALACR